MREPPSLCPGSVPEPVSIRPVRIVRLRLAVVRVLAFAFCAARSSRILDSTSYTNRR